MSSIALAKWFADVTVHFVGHAPSEDVVRFALHCAKERWLTGPLTVVVEGAGDASASQHQIRIERPGHDGVVHSGPELLPAIRAAFDRFELV